MSGRGSESVSSSHFVHVGHGDGDGVVRGVGPVGGAHGDGVLGLVLVVGGAGERERPRAADHEHAGAALQRPGDGDLLGVRGAVGHDCGRVLRDAGGLVPRDGWRLVHVGNPDGHGEAAPQLARLRVPVVLLGGPHGHVVGLVSPDVGALVVGEFLEAERAVRRVDLEAAMVAGGLERPRHALLLRVRGVEAADFRPAVLDDAEGARAAPRDHRRLVHVRDGHGHGRGSSVRPPSKALSVTSYSGCCSKFGETLNRQHRRRC